MGFSNEGRDRLNAGSAASTAVTDMASFVVERWLPNLANDQSQAREIRSAEMEFSEPIALPSRGRPPQTRFPILDLLHRGMDDGEWLYGGSQTASIVPAMSLELGIRDDSCVHRVAELRKIGAVETLHAKFRLSSQLIDIRSTPRGTEYFDGLCGMFPEIKTPSLIQIGDLETEVQNALGELGLSLLQQRDRSYMSDDAQEAYIERLNKQLDSLVEQIDQRNPRLKRAA